MRRSIAALSLIIATGSTAAAQSSPTKSRTREPILRADLPAKPDLVNVPTLYTVGSVKRVASSTIYVAVDGGMSDNPRPALYGARYTALIATRADAPATDVYAIAGKHCESGDVLIDRVDLPAPQRGDILAVPSTGAYTLAMSSSYNVVPRPAAVLVADGNARVIRKRETIDDLLALENG